MNKLTMFLKRIEWVNFLFLLSTPVIAVIGTNFLIHYHAIRLPTVLFAIVYAVATGLAVTAGYHRLFAHRSFEASRLTKMILLFLGAASFENSVWHWAADHRDHHKFVDTDLDPYNIKKGFWYAHIGWILFKRKGEVGSTVSDLWNDPLVRFQNRFYLLIAVVAGFVVPFSVGAIWHDPIGGLILAGFARIVLNHHFTFSINSVCHYLGSQPYSDKNSSRDSWIPALFTYGEGYHNYHHTFPSDYRNGTKGYQWDPTKWLIRTLEWVGHASELRRISDYKIMAVRIRMDEKRLFKKLENVPNPTPWRDMIEVARLKLEEVHTRFLSLRTEYRSIKAERVNAFNTRWTDRWTALNERVRILKEEMKQAERNFQESFESWKRLCSYMQKSAILA